MAQPTYALLVDWEGDGLFGHEEADVWRNAISIRTEVGRDYSSQVYGRSTAGQLTVLLDDPTGLYSRFNPNSSLYGLVIPNRRVRFTMQLEGDTEATAIWGGYLDTIRPSPQRVNRQIVELRALGIISLLVARQVDVGAQVDVTIVEAINLILQAAGFLLSDLAPVVPFPTTSAISVWWSPEQSALQALRYIEHTEAGFIRELPDGDLRFENRYHRAQGGRRQRDVGFADTETVELATAGYLPYDDISMEDPVKDVANYVRIPIHDYTIGTDTEVLWTSDETPIRIRRQVDQPDLYSVTAAPSTSGVAIAWEEPESGTDYVGNSAEDGTGTDTTDDLTVTAVLHSTSVDFTINNTGTGGTYLTTLQARGRVITDEGESEIIARDDASVQTYGERAYLFPANFISEPQDAEDYADVLLRQLREPYPKIRIFVRANYSDEMLQQIMTLQVSDRVVVLPPNYYGPPMDMHIENIRHEVSAPSRHMVRYTLSSAAATGVEDVIVLDDGPGLGEGRLGR